jgi:WD40 repeat protein
MESPRIVRIFFSSPGDVKMERETARKIVGRLQIEVGDPVIIEPYFWEHEALSATKDYQQNIPAMNTFDVVVCMLWSRLGTPLHPERHPRPGGGFFESGTEYEFFTAMSAFRESGTPNIFVFRNFTEPRRPSRPKEARELADRELDRLDHFFERYFQSGNFFTAAVNEYRTLGEFEDKLSLGLRAFLLEIAPAAPQSGKSLSRYDGQPYLGLAAFDFDDAPVFYGRTAQVGAVIEALQVQEMDGAGLAEASRRFILLVGSSGSGKSSLARAGVLPMLIQPGVIEGAELWRRAVFKPADAQADPFLALASALLADAALPELASDGTSAAALAALLSSQPAGAGMLVRQALSQAAVAEKTRLEHLRSEEIHQLSAENRLDDVAEKRATLANLKPPVARLAVVVDQLEEIFTGNLGEDLLDRFITALHSLAMSGRVFAIATLRSDFYSHCLEHPLLVELMKGSGSYVLTPPSPGDLAQMIRQPAITAGLEFEENNATGDKLDEIIRDAAMRDASALPLLSYALEQLYEKRSAEGVMTLAAYRDLGGLEGAIGQRAEQTFQALPLEGQASFDEVWRRLVTLSQDGAAVRRRLVASTLPADSGIEKLVTAFTEARLLTADRAADGGRILSVAHEALLRHWPRVIEWLEGNRDFLRVRSRIATRLAEWEDHGRAEDYLVPTGIALAEAQQIFTDYESALDAPERDYIGKSIARAKNQERSKLRRARAIMVGALVLSAIAIGGGIFAWSERGKATRNARLALEQKSAAQAAESKAKASQVRAAYQQGCDLLESGKTRQGLTSLMQGLENDATHEGIQRRLYSYHLYGLPKAIPIHSVQAPGQSRQRISGALSGADQRVAYLSKDHTVEAYDLNARKVIPGPWEKEPDSFAAIMSPGNQFVLNIRQDSSCRIWFLDGRENPPPIQLTPDFANMSTSDSGNLIMEGATDGTMRFWETATGKLLGEKKQAGPVRSLGIGGGGGLIAFASDELVFYKADSLAEIKRHRKEGMFAVDIEVSADQKVAVCQYCSILTDEKPAVSTLFVFYSMETGEELSSREIEFSSEVFSFKVNHDGTLIAVASFSTYANVYHRTDSREDRSFPFATFPVKVLFSPDGLLFIAADSEGTVKIFDAGTGSEALVEDGLRPAKAAVPARQVFEPIHHEGRLQDMLISWDGQYLMTSTNSLARIWDLSVGRALTQPLTSAGTFHQAGFANGGSRILTASATGIRRYDAQTLEASGDTLLPSNQATRIQWGDAQKIALAQTDPNTLLLANLTEAGKAPLTINRPSPITTSALSPDETRVGIYQNNKISLLDSVTGKPVGPPQQLPAATTSLSFSGDSRHLVAIQEKQIHLFSAVDGTAVPFRHPSFAFSYSTYTTMGSHLAIHAGSNDVKNEWMTLIWDLSDLAAAPVILYHDDSVLSLSFGPQAASLLTCSRDQIAQVWDTRTGQPLGPPLLHRDNPVQRGVLSHNGKWAATTCNRSGAGDVVRVWDWRDARQTAEEIVTYGTVLSLAFSPDDCLLMVNSTRTGTEGKTYTRLYELAPAAGQKVDLHSLTEATVASQLTALGSYATVDPTSAWERIRAGDPQSWFLQDPSKRNVSPNLRSSSMRWITDNDVLISEAIRAMPAVGVIRAAVCFWENNTIVDRVLAAQKLEPESDAYKKEILEINPLYARVLLLRESAARNAFRDVDVCFYLARAAQKLEDYPEARKWILKAFEMEPNRVDILSLANEVLYLHEDPEVLFTALEKLCEDSPGNPNFAVRKAALLCDQGKREQAVPILEKALASAAIGTESRIMALVLLGRYQEADTTISKVTAEEQVKDPNYQTPHTRQVYHILCRHQLGDSTGAEADFAALIIASPVFMQQETLLRLDFPRVLIETVTECWKKTTVLKSPKEG